MEDICDGDHEYGCDGDHEYGCDGDHEYGDCHGTRYALCMFCGDSTFCEGCDTCEEEERDE